MTSLRGRRIAIALRPGEPGHQSCAIALAKRLAACGCESTFVGLPDDGVTIERAGFSFLALSARAAPVGAIAREKELARHRRSAVGKVVQEFRWVALHRRIVDGIPESLDAIRKARVDLVLCDNGNPVAAFAALGLGLPCVLLETTVPMDHRTTPPPWTTYAPRSDGSMPLRARVARARRTFGQFQDFVAPLFGLGQRQIARRLAGPGATIRTFAGLRAELPRIIACPVEFEFPGRRPERWSYVDALVDLDRSSDPFDWGAVPAGRDVVYVAMGTQTWLIRERDRLFATFFAAASMMPDVHVVLAAGEARRGLGPAPHNVTVLEHAPQLAILSQATVMVTHAGLNSVKESISMGVPMVALPVSRDQPGNAARIAYHGLGVHLDYRRLTPTALHAAIEQVRRNPTFRQATRRMQAQFADRRRRNEVVEVVERHMARSSG